MQMECIGRGDQE